MSVSLPNNPGTLQSSGIYVNGPQKIPDKEMVKVVLKKVILDHFTQLDEKKAECDRINAECDRKIADAERRIAEADQKIDEGQRKTARLKLEVIVDLFYKIFHGKKQFPLKSTRQFLTHI